MTRKPIRRSHRPLTTIDLGRVIGGRSYDTHELENVTTTYDKIVYEQK